MIKRPQNLSEVQGQEEAKKILRIAIDAAIAKNEAVGHVLLLGPSGCGKTTLAQAIAAERKVDCFSVIATSLKSEKDIKEVLASKLNAEGYTQNNPEPIEPDKVKPTIIFIDEIHNLPRKVYETLYTVMEDRIYWDERKSAWGNRSEKVKMWVPKFTLVGATTREGDLEKPFLDRFTYRVRIRRYTDAECVKFVANTLEYNKIKLEDPKIALSIAKRARGTARVAIQLTLQCIDMCIAQSTSILTQKIVNDYFAICGIDEFGLGEIDRGILTYMNSADRPIGIAAIASFLQETKSSIEAHYEPFLVEKGLMGRTPGGRVITHKGKEYLAYKRLDNTLDKRREVKDHHTIEFSL